MKTDEQAAQIQKLTTDLEAVAKSAEYWHNIALKRSSLISEQANEVRAYRARIAELESILYNKLPNYLNRKRMNTPPLDRTPIPQEIYRDYIAGVQFGQYKEAYADNALHVGDVLKLVWERSNQYDPNAVAIYTADGKYRLGYIKKIDTRLLHDFRTRNIKLSAYLHECDFTAKPWQMFAVRITAPNIIRTSSDPDLEF